MRCSKPSTLLQLLGTCASSFSKCWVADLWLVRRFCAAPCETKTISVHRPAKRDRDLHRFDSLLGGVLLLAGADCRLGASSTRRRALAGASFSSSHHRGRADDILAGFASYTHDGYLDFLFTHPTFARRGVATSLYQRVESALRAVSASRVTTHASLAARPFFDGHGFQVDAEQCVECRGAYLRRFAMHKQLRNERNS